MADRPSVQLSRLEELSGLDERSIGRVVQAVDGKDLIIAMKGMTWFAQKQILSSLSKGAAAMIREDLDAVGVVPPEVIAKVGGVVLGIANQLGVRGELGWRPATPASPQPDGSSEPPRQPSDLEAVDAELSGIPPGRRNTPDLVAWLVALARKVRRSGLIVIGEYEKQFADENLLAYGLRQSADGREWKDVERSMLARREQLLAAHRVRLDVITDGVLGIARSDSPGIVSERCVTRIRPDVAPVAPPDDDAWMNGELDGLPASRRNADALVPLLAAIARLARRNGVLALEDHMMKRVDDDFLKLGLTATVDGAGLEGIGHLLVVRGRALTAAYAQRQDVIMTGVEGLAQGSHPGWVETMCLAHVTPPAPGCLWQVRSDR